MTTTLTIPSKIQNTAPKPTKSQLLEALLDRARKSHELNEKEKEKKREELEKKCEALMRAHIKNLKPSDFSCNLMTYWTAEREVQVSCDFTTKEIIAVKKQLDQNKEAYFQEDATKQKIREGLKTPNPLLDNNDVSKALDQLLATIMKPQPKLSNTVDV